jgi:hypothetical protein
MRIPALTGLVLLALAGRAQDPPVPDLPVAPLQATETAAGHRIYRLARPRGEARVRPADARILRFGPRGGTNVLHVQRIAGDTVGGGWMNGGSPAGGWQSRGWRCADGSECLHLQGAGETGPLERMLRLTGNGLCLSIRDRAPGEGEHRASCLLLEEGTLLAADSGRGLQPVSEPAGETKAAWRACAWRYGSWILLVSAGPSAEHRLLVTREDGAALLKTPLQPSGEDGAATAEIRLQAIPLKAGAGKTEALDALRKHAPGPDYSEPKDSSKDSARSVSSTFSTTSPSATAGPPAQ